MSLFLICKIRTRCFEGVSQVQLNGTAFNLQQVLVATANLAQNQQYVLFTMKGSSQLQSSLIKDIWVGKRLGRCFGNISSNCLKE